jgi:DNA repair photolyase
MPFDWTINPYRGCEFGCKYCYARYTHEFMELREPHQFETLIFAKHFHAPAFRHELAAIPRDQAIAIGTGTDPYQPAERRYRLTRRILEILAEDRGRQLSITTKSDLVARDADLLARISRCNYLSVNHTVTTTDTELARALEPKAPRPDLRLAAVRTLTGQGILAGVFACPVLPGINDTVDSLRSVAKAAAASGARYFHAHAVYLPPAAHRVFLPFVREKFPQLAARYEEMFRNDMYIRGEYPAMLRRRVEAIREEAGLQGNVTAYELEDARDPQLSLFS